MALLCPCKNCTERQLHCHITCQKYKIYKSKYHILKAREKREMERRANVYYLGAWLGDNNIQYQRTKRKRQEPKE